MDLILWRHAYAEGASPGEPDASRKLTASGENQARRMAAWLKKQLPRDVVVLASPAQRAQQTAQALTMHFKTSPEVGTAARPQSVPKATGWPGGEGAVLVVGHQPTLGQAAALALTGTAQDWSVRNGAIWWLESRGRDGAVVRAVVTPELIQQPVGLGPMND